MAEQKYEKYWKLTVEYIDLHDLNFISRNIDILFDQGYQLDAIFLIPQRVKYLKNHREIFSQRLSA